VKAVLDGHLGAVGQRAVVAPGSTAEARAGLEQRDVHPALGEHGRRDAAGDTAADHDDVQRPSDPQRAARIALDEQVRTASRRPDHETLTTEQRTAASIR
jgi:hypothetical protein